MPLKPLRLIVGAVGLAVLGLAIFLNLKPRPDHFDRPVAVTTLAGDGGWGFADGPGAEARFSDPFAVAVDARGAVYVADAGETNRIRRIGRDGRTTTLPGEFETPSGVAVDARGNVYVAETGANRIRRIGRDGTVVTLAGDGTAGYRDGPAIQAQFNGPIGVAVDRSGHVYVADTYNDRIRLITPDGQVKTLAGGEPGFADDHGAAAAFNTPCGIAIADDGALLVADTGNDAIRRIDKDGVVTTLARWAPDGPAAVLRGPIGLAAGADGRVFLSTFRGARLLDLSATGDLRVLTGPEAAVPENAALRLVRPAGLAVDRKGTLYVAESARYAIRKLAPHPRRRGPPPAPTDLVPAAPTILQAASVPWPFAPQSAWREVVGTMGEARGSGGPDGRLHSGLDIRGDVGETVYAIADEKVLSPLAAFSLGEQSEGLQIGQLTYIHIRVGRTATGAPLDPARFQLIRDPAGKLTSVRVKRGARFQAGAPLGTVNAQAHVHLDLGSRAGDANPMGLRFPDLTDSKPPQIAGIQLFDASGRRLTEREQGRLIIPRGSGPLSIVADAWDHVDGNGAHRRLGLYRAGFQILDVAGAPVRGFEQPLINIEFDRLPLERGAAQIAFAPGSSITVHGAAQTRFLHIVSNRVRGGRAEAVGWSPADLAPGDYTVRIFAADFAGNVAVKGRDLPIGIR